MNKDEVYAFNGVLFCRERELRLQYATVCIKKPKGDIYMHYYNYINIQNRKINGVRCGGKWGMV
jgi:hypothetical protein